MVESSEPEDHHVFSIDVSPQAQRLVQSHSETYAGPEQRIMGRVRRRWHLYLSLCSPLKQQPTPFVGHVHKVNEFQCIATV